MKRTILLIILTACLGTAEAMSFRTLLDEGWQYIYGEHTTLPTADEWKQARTLNLPHDWSVETDAVAAHGEHIGPFVKDGDYQKGFMLGGEAWYRRTFRINEELDASEMYLYFEGAYNHATIFVNGKQIYFNHYGYQGFKVPLTDCLKRNAVNELVVKCENKGLNTRWYSGSGIFRHVWLMQVPRNAMFDEWDVSIQTLSYDRTNTTDVRAHMLAEVEVALPVNSQRMELWVTDAAGRRMNLNSSTDGVQTVIPVSTLIPAGDRKCKVTFNFELTSQLWSAESPVLYYAHIRNAAQGADLPYEVVVPFGVRKISYDTERGFMVNGESVLLRGGCVHHDHGLLGAASWDDAEVRKIELMKLNGFNAVRCSHNLPSEAMLRACDSLGMYVIDECFDQWFVEKNHDDYHNYFARHYLFDFETMLRRDRNHPSVVMWSIGNEIPGRSEERSMVAARNMRDLVQRLDPDHRPVTAALCTWDNTRVDWRGDYAFKTTVSLDIVGYNYMWHDYDRDVKEHQWLILGTETYAKEASQNWDRVEREPKIVGDFVWTAMDYLGEAGIGHGFYVKDGEQSPFFAAYPYYNGWCGDIDLIGQKKPQSYYRDVVWHRSPITMAVELPCPQGYHREISGWGWQPEVNAWEDPKVFFTQHNLPNIMYNGAGKPLSIDKKAISGKGLNVNVYSRSKQVRLYLNDRLVDTKQTGDTYHAGFVVDYEPGTLRAVEFDGEKEGASFTLQTAGKPAAIRIKIDKYSKLHYITAELVDREGNIVHEYERRVTFSIKSDARMLAAGNANPTDMESFRISSPRFYDGRAMAIVEPAGNYIITAQSNGVKAVCKP